MAMSLRLQKNFYLNGFTFCLIYILFITTYGYNNYLSKKI